MDCIYGDREPDRRDTHALWMLCKMLQVVGPASLKQPTFEYASCIDVLLWTNKSQTEDPLDLMNGPRDAFLDAADAALVAGGA